MGRSLWLDTSPHRTQEAALASSAAQAAAGTPSWVLGVVRATHEDEPALPRGWLRVGIPHDAPTSEVTGLSDGGVSAVGSIVQVTLDATGRVVSISSPITLPPGSAPVPTGAVGRILTEGLAKAEDDLERTSKRLGEELAAAEERLAGAEVPTDRIVPGPSLIGGALLADGAVTAEKLVASRELWARVASFAEVTTDMLTAGRATVTGTAVVGDLVGNRLSGGELSLLDSDGQASTQTAPRSGWVPGEASGTSVSQAATGVLVTGRTPFAQFSAALKGGLGPGEGDGAGTVVTATIDASDGVDWWLTVSYKVGDEPGSTQRFSTSSTATVAVPDGARILSVVVGGQVSVRNVSPRLLIRDVSVSWRPARTSGLRIWRDASGQARIDVATGSGLATLTSDGVTYTQGATRVGRTSWRSLVQPPAAFITWAPGAGANASSGTDGLLTVDTAASRSLLGGCSIADGYCVVPTAGWYAVDVSCGFSWASTQASWAVSVGVCRRSRRHPDWDNDPAMTLPLIAGVTTKPSVCGLMHLDAGDGLCLAFWQNTGSWKPNSGLSRLSLYMLHED